MQEMRGFYEFYDTLYDIMDGITRLYGLIKKEKHQTLEPWREGTSIYFLHLNSESFLHNFVQRLSTSMSRCLFTLCIHGYISLFVYQALTNSSAPCTKISNNL